MRILAIMTAAAFAAALPAAGMAQPAASPHQHGQPATPAQTPQANQHKAPQGAETHCDCCGMMNEMVQMMRTMHQHGSKPGAMQKMDMMQSPGSPQPGSTPGDAAEHPQHEGKPRN